MYPKLRTIHLLIALPLLPFVGVYALSAFAIAHPWLVPAAGTQEQFEVPLPDGVRDAGAIADLLQQQRGVLGDVHGVKGTQEGLRFEIVWPGVSHGVLLPRGSHVAQIQAHRHDVVGALTVIHGTSGLYHRDPRLGAWGVMQLLTSLGLTALGVTGVWMWLLRRRERRLGLWVVGLSSAYGVLALVLVRMAP